MKSKNSFFKKAFVAFAFVLFSVNIQAQLISGVIRNADHKPLEKVIVKVAGTETQVMTDAEGKFSVMMTLGDASLEISKDGFNSEVVTITKNQQTLNVLLIPDLLSAMNKPLKIKKCRKHTLLSTL